MPALLIVMQLITLALAQKSTNASPNRLAQETHSKKPVLTEKQKRGLRMLGEVQIEAAALQPDMRAYIEWQASMGYQKFDLKKSNALLESAFTATDELSSTRRWTRLAIRGNCWTDETCRVKHWLEDKILEEMEKRSPDRALELSSGLEPGFQTAVETRLLGYYLQQKHLGKAKEMLDRMAGDDGYPYAAAADLMQAIPKSRAAERTAIFSQALANYRQFNTDLMVDEGDFGGMLLRCWRDLPPEIALDAVDAILEKSKIDSDENKEPLTIITLHHGSIRFTSNYQVRIFEVLPLLRELDSARADALLRDQISLQDLVKQYPDGMFSIERDFGKNEPYTEGSHREILDMEPGFDDASDDSLQQRYARMQDTIKREPRDALAMALAMPEPPVEGLFHPRLGALMEVAQGTVKKSPEICRSALWEMRQLVGSDHPPEITDLLLQAADLYHQMGDTDNAKTTLKQAARSIDQHYKKDSDLGDPNQAFKGNWPSTQLWGKCLHLSTWIAPELQEPIMADIPDPEIQTFLKVMIANALLGAEHPGKIIVTEAHNDGKRRFMMR
jgi:hypothetical protein